MTACFLTGPVTLRSEVRAAFLESPASHRGRDFLASMRRVRAALTSLVNASNAVVMVGSGTLANDAVAAQLRRLESPGLILSNGEFGERLVDHAHRFELEFSVARRPWGQGFDWDETRRVAAQRRPSWVWAVATETSTGVANPLAELRALSESLGADLCLDVVSAIGLTPLDLRGVRFASASSGKGLAAYPGLALVFHDGRLADSRGVPRYLDLASYEAADGVPFTHSSNLVAALECSLMLTNWSRKLDQVLLASRSLRDALRRVGLPPLVPESRAAAGVVTLAIPSRSATAEVAAALARQGMEIAWQSSYLRERNWMQIALMGEIDLPALAALPQALSRQVARPVARPQAASCRMMPSV